VCVCKKERRRKRDTDERKREGDRECNNVKRAFKNKLNSGRGWEESASICTSQIAFKAQSSNDLNCCYLAMYRIIVYPT
jgi:hypothetical protein